MYALSPTFLVVLVVAGCLQTGQSTLADVAPRAPSGVTCSALGAVAGYGGGISVLDIVSDDVGVLEVQLQAGIELIPSC